MQDAEMQKELADKKVVVFRGKTKDAIDMQLCKMGIVPYTMHEYTNLGRQETGIDKKYIAGLVSISKSIGKPGLESVSYKGFGGTGEGNRYSYNEKMNKRTEALGQKAFFDFFFAQNPNLNHLKEKLIEEAMQYTDDSIEAYSFMGGKENEEIINEIYDTLGVDRVNETINAYNENARASFKQRHQRFIEGLPERDVIQSHSLQIQPIEDTIGIDFSDNMEAVTSHVKSKIGCYSNIGSQIPLASIMEYAREINELFGKVENVQSQNSSTSKVHGIQHVKNVLLLSNYLGLINGMSNGDLRLIREAAIYHDICHEQSGDPSHAKRGSDWYLENVDSTLDKDEVAFLIEAHELDGERNFANLVTNIFPGITEQRKAELIRCAKILQDADILDILRYDIEKPDYQRFQPGRLNNPQSAELISAVIELNTRQAINKGYLQIKNNRVQIREALNTGEIEQNGSAKTTFEESSLSSDLQILSSETTISGFNDMNQNIKNVQKSREQGKTTEDTREGKKDEGWDVDEN